MLRAREVPEGAWSTVNQYNYAGAPTSLLYNGYTDAEHDHDGRKDEDV